MVSSYRLAAKDRSGVLQQLGFPRRDLRGMNFVTGSYLSHRLLPLEAPPGLHGP